MDWAQIHGESGENPWTDYLPLCRSCHIRYDKSGHRTPHTDATKVKMSASARLAYAEGRSVGGNTYQSGKDHCPQDHPYDETNTYTDKRGFRYCRECQRAQTRRWRRRKAEAAASASEVGVA